MTALGKCPNCGTPLSEAPGIAIWCANKECPVEGPAGWPERTTLRVTERGPTMLHWRFDMDAAPHYPTRLLVWTDTSVGDADLLNYIEVACEGEHITMAQVGMFDGAEWELPIIGVPIAWALVPPPERLLR